MSRIFSYLIQLFAISNVRAMEQNNAVDIHLPNSSLTHHNFNVKPTFTTSKRPLFFDDDIKEISRFKRQDSSDASTSSDDSKIQYVCNNGNTCCENITALLNKATQREEHLTKTFSNQLNEAWSTISKLIAENKEIKEEIEGGIKEQLMQLQTMAEKNEKDSMKKQSETNERLVFLLLKMETNQVQMMGDIVEIKDHLNLGFKNQSDEVSQLEMSAQSNKEEIINEINQHRGTTESALNSQSKEIAEIVNRFNELKKATQEIKMKINESIQHTDKAVDRINESIEQSVTTAVMNIKPLPPPVQAIENPGDKDNDPSNPDTGTGGINGSNNGGSGSKDKGQSSGGSNDKGPGGSGSKDKGKGSGGSKDKGTGGNNGSGNGDDDSDESGDGSHGEGKDKNKGSGGSKDPAGGGSGSDDSSEDSSDEDGPLDKEGQKHACIKTRAKREKMVNYFKSISGSKTLTGIYSAFDRAYRNKGVETIKRITGMKPGILTTRMPKYSAGKEAWDEFIKDTIAKWKMGHFVHLQWYTNENPLSSLEALKNGDDSKWKDLMRNGGRLNKLWKKQLDAIVPYLKQLEAAGVVPIFEILPIINYKQGLWSQRPGNDGSLKLYQMTHDYLKKHHKLENLIWAWSVEVKGDLEHLEEYWPGDDYVDVVSVYMWRGNHKRLEMRIYDKVLDVAGEKPISMECIYTVPSPQLLTAQPDWAWFTMCEAELHNRTYNTDRSIKAAFKSPTFVHRENNEFFNKGKKSKTP